MNTASVRVKVRVVSVKWIAQLGLLRQVDGDLSSKSHKDCDRSALWGGAGDRNGVLNSRLPTWTISVQGRFEHLPSSPPRSHEVELTRRHGPDRRRTRAMGHHPAVPRRASQGMPTTRAPAGPRRRQAA